MHTEFVDSAHSTHESTVAPISPRVVTDGVVAVAPMVASVPCGCAAGPAQRDATRGGQVLFEISALLPRRLRPVKLLVGGDQPTKRR